MLSKARREAVHEQARLWPPLWPRIALTVLASIISIWPPARPNSKLKRERKMEKRIPIAIVVHLARVGHQTAESAELTFTDNISAHGACVISARHWKPGEMAEVTSLNDKIMLVGRVTY